MAGGGVKGGIVHGETDEFSYNIVKDPVHVRDLQATLLHQFGIDHEKFTYKYQGLDQKLGGGGGVGMFLVSFFVSRPPTYRPPAGFRENWLRPPVRDPTRKGYPVLCPEDLHARPPPPGPPPPGAPG